MKPHISPRQLRTLQTLYARHAGGSGDEADVSPVLPAHGDARSERLAWASQQIARPLASFRELRGDEAAGLIDTLKRSLGQEVKPAWPRLRRDAAMARGTHGRKGRTAKVEMMVTPEALEEIERLRERAGMSPEQFAGWLRSRHSPLCWRAEARLLTISDCNRVRWALQAMLRHVAPGHAATEESKASLESGTRSGLGRPEPLNPTRRNNSP